MLNYRSYITFAEKLLLSYEDDSFNRQELLISSILLSWIAIESFVNNMLDDFVSLPEELFTLHEQGFLLEQDVSFVDDGNNLGTFELTKKKYNKLSDKILFLIRKFNPEIKSFKGNKLWQDFEKLKKLRNKIAHPKKDDDISIDAEKVKESIQTAKDIILFIAEKVWKKKVEY